jgi:hypothetical protein
MTVRRTPRPSASSSPNTSSRPHPALPARDQPRSLPGSAPGTMKLRELTHADWPQLLALNLASVRELSELDEQRLGWILSLAHRSLAVEYEGEMVAFALAIALGTACDSQNYRGSTLGSSDSSTSTGSPSPAPWLSGEPTSRPSASRPSGSSCRRIATPPDAAGTPRRRKRRAGRWCCRRSLSERVPGSGGRSAWRSVCVRRCRIDPERLAGVGVLSKPVQAERVGGEPMQPGCRHVDLRPVGAARNGEVDSRRQLVGQIPVRQARAQADRPVRNPRGELGVHGRVAVN